MVTDSARCQSFGSDWSAVSVEREGERSLPLTAGWHMSVYTVLSDLTVQFFILLYLMSGFVLCTYTRTNFRSFYSRRLINALYYGI